jgi:hypothetical protein
VLIYPGKFRLHGGVVDLLLHGGVVDLPPVHTERMYTGTQIGKK